MEPELLVDDVAEQGHDGESDLPTDEHGNRQRPPTVHSFLIARSPDEPDWISER